LRIVHFSDTHLGYYNYSKLDLAEGVNQREADFYKAFRQAVDKAIELEPDMVIHAGDLFHVIRPQNRAIHFAMNELIRLSEAGIETVLISGNHETPRLKETGSIFGIFEHLAHIHPIYRPGIGRLTIGEATVQAIPHSVEPSISSLVAQASPVKETRYNVLVLHAGVDDPKGTYRTADELSEQTVPGRAISDEFDYVALGHYHKHEKIRARVVYSGSTERLSFNEVDQKKGVVEVDLASGSVEFHEINVREMLDLGPIDAAGMASSELLREAKRVVDAASVDGKIVRLSIKNISQDAYRGLDVAVLRKSCSSAMHFEPKIERAEEEARRAATEAQIGSLASEFRKYVQALKVPEQKRQRILDMGTPYFAGGDE
jgi:DNA repair exonuclease SbcCD nuclease subunit